AGIRHVEAKHEAGVGFARTHMQAHRAFRGELQRVVDQIGEDLADQRCIALDETRAGRADIEPAGETPLAGSGLKALWDALHTIVKVKRRGVELEPSGIELGEIENVIENREQTSCRLM